MKSPAIFFLLCLCAILSGCVDKPGSDPKTFGKVVAELPTLAEAEKPFDFPYAGDVDHSKCVFKEEEFF